MQRLDEGLSGNHTGNALLYTICALGAKYVTLSLLPSNNGLRDKC